MNVHPLISAIDAFLAEIDAKLSAAPKEIISDDQIHRFSTKKAGRDDNGWYIFHDGEFPAGSFGDWSTGEKFKWRARETSSLSEKERKRLQKVKVERAKMQEAAYAAAAASAFRRWSNAARAREDHPYLVKKGVGAHGIREAHGALLVPLTSDGEEVISLQTIDAEGNKLFSQNSRTRGGHFFIGEPSSDNIVIVEGYATGASIYEATEPPSVIGFNAGNLTEVGKAIRLRFPRARIIFAADDDWGTECDKGVNPGVVNARKAAETVGGCVVIPPFNRDAGETGTDWNDFGALHGKAALEETFLRLMEEAGPAAKAAPWDEEGEDGQASEDGETTGIKLPHGFTITETGVYWREDNADGTPIRLCGPIEILASTRDSRSTAWGLLLRWRDEDGVVHEWAMPRKLLDGDGAEIRKKMLDEGLFVAAGQKARNKLSEFLLSVRVDARARCVDKIGWYGDAYVLPGSSFGATGEQVVLQTTSPPVFDIKGELKGWKQEVASLAIGNSRIAMAISAAFAGPLLKMAGETSFGLHFSGPSSIGKTLALRAATSVW